MKKKFLFFCVSEWQRFERLTSHCQSVCERNGILILVGESVLIGYIRKQKRQWTRWAFSCLKPSFRRLIG